MLSVGYYDWEWPNVDGDAVRFYSDLYLISGSRFRVWHLSI